MTGVDAERYDLYNRGLNDREIADILMYERTTITIWRNKHGLPKNDIGGRPKLSSKEHNARLKLWRNGYTDTEIARALYMSRAAVYAWRRKNGLKKNGGHT